MKKAFPLFLVALFELTINAESLSVSSSGIDLNPYTVINKAGLIENKIYQIQGVDDEMSLTIYDKGSYKKIKENNFKQRKCKKTYCIDNHFAYSNTIFLRNKILVFFKTYEKTSGSTMLFAQEFDLNGNFVGKLVTVDNFASKKRDDVAFYIFPNKDSTRFSIICNPYDKKGDEKVGLKIYDENLKNIANIAIELPYKDKDLYFIDNRLGNDDIIYILGRTTEYYLFTVDAKNNKIGEYKINLPDKKIIDLQFEIDYVNKVIIFGGLYADVNPEESKDNDTDGLFCLKTNILTNEIKTKIFIPIKSYAVNNVMHILQNSDGTSVIIAENRLAIRGSHFGRGSNGGFETTTWTDYTRGNLAILKIAPDGTAFPVVEIPKRQVSKDDNGYFGSYLPLLKGNRLCIVFNDDPDNPNETQRKYPMSNPKKANFVKMEINDDGTFTQNIMFYNKEKKMIPVPERGFEIGKGISIIPVTDLGKSNVGTIKLEF